MIGGIDCKPASDFFFFLLSLDFLASLLYSSRPESLKVAGSYLRCMRLKVIFQSYFTIIYKYWRQN